MDEDPDLPYHRQVVTCFVCKLDGTSFKHFQVAIFRRSEYNKSHEGLWAACSATIKSPHEDSLEVAWRSLREKTGLTPSQLSLLHAGKPHGVLAKDFSRRWTIHPFAFVLSPDADPNAICLNDKHTDYRFVQPEEVETYDTVPDLDITLWRTLVGPDTARGLRELRDDHASGARSLATKAVRILLLSVTGADLDWSSNVKSYWRGFRLVAWHLAVNGRPSMGAAIGRAVLRSVVLASPGVAAASSVEAAKQAIVDACVATLRERAEGRGRVARQFADYLGSPTCPAPTQRAETTFLTLSISCAKLCVLEYARLTPEMAVHVIVLESRPCYEGVRMALALESQVRELNAARPGRVRITLGVDASVATLATAVDFVVLGSDRIAAGGDVSNKVGSMPAILTAKALSARPVEVLIASETEKIEHLGGRGDAFEDNGPDEVVSAWGLADKERSTLLGRDQGRPSRTTGISSSLGRTLSVEAAGGSGGGGGGGVSSGASTPEFGRQHDPGAQWPGDGGHLHIPNVTFEWIPERFVDKYITEIGVLKTDEIRQQSEIAHKEWEDVFSDL